MYAVTEIEFEEVGIAINGVYCGLFSGTADVDSDGAITSIVLDGWQDGSKARTRLDVPYCGSNRTTWNGTLALVLADEIRQQYAHIIREKLDDWADSLSIREAAE